MAVLAKNKLVIHIPKTAGESLAKWLIDHCDGKEVGWKHSTINDINVSQYTSSFAVVRHPFNRLTSWYSHLVRELNTKGSKRNRETRKIIVACEKEDGVNSYIQYCLNDTFPHYLIWKPQVFFINQDTEIFKFESLQDDFNIIQHTFNCFEELPFKNFTKSNQYSLSSQSKDILRNIYKDDFINFNYNEDC